MICTVLFLALGCLLVFFNFWTVKKYQSIKVQGAGAIEAFNESYKYWKLFYLDFNDDDFWSQNFWHEKFFCEFEMKETAEKMMTHFGL